MNSLAFLARSYDRRALTSISSSSRLAAQPTPSASAHLLSPLKRSASFSAIRAGSKALPQLSSKRPASSPSTPARRSPSLSDAPPSIAFAPLADTNVITVAQWKLLVRCHALLWRTMRVIWTWLLPNASRAVAHSELDVDEKPIVSDDALTDDEHSGGTLALHTSLSRSSRDLDTAEEPPDAKGLRFDLTHSRISDSEPPLPITAVTPATPSTESPERPWELLSVDSSSSISYLHTFSSTQTALLPNPLPTALVTSSPSPSISQKKAVASNPSFPKKTLVLDLDETLIHSTSRPLSSATGSSGMLGLGGLFGKRSQAAGHMVEVILNGRSTLYHVYKRPFVDYFLRKVSGWYTLVIFTASMQEYADPVIDWLDGGRGLFHRRLFRESCTQQGASYTKDLALVDEDLSRICLIDNSPVSYTSTPANGIPIEGWISDPSDEALLDLLPVLDSLRFTSDVRRVLGIRGF